MLPLVISHRAEAGTQLENSLAGIEAAIAEGADGVEVDLRCTADRELVLMHDRSLVRTTGDPRNVDEVTMDELRALTLIGDPTQRVPTLREALDRCAGRIRLVIDVKQPGIAATLAAVLAEYASRTQYWTWTPDLRIARELVDALPGVEVSLIVRPERVAAWNHRDGMARARWIGLAGLLFEHPYVDASLIAAADRMGVTLHCGRTNDPADLDRVVRLGPASVCSDRSAVAIEARTEATTARVPLAARA